MQLTGVNVYRQLLATIQREQKLRAELEGVQGANAVNGTRLQDIERENLRLREALEWYANEDNYDDECRPIRAIIAESVDCQEFDVGKTGRLTLSVNQPSQNKYPTPTETGAHD